MWGRVVARDLHHLLSPTPGPAPPTFPMWHLSSPPPCPPFKRIRNPREEVHVVHDSANERSQKSRTSVRCASTSGWCEHCTWLCVCTWNTVHGVCKCVCWLRRAVSFLAVWSMDVSCGLASRWLRIWVFTSWRRSQCSLPPESKEPL